jgi:peptidyl-prolyl cis-trans isomerase SurA
LKFARRTVALALVFAAAVAFATTAFAATPSKPAAPAKPAAHPSATAAGGTHSPAAPARRAPAAAPSGGETLDAVAAMVNDEAVLVSDVEEQMMFVLRQMQQSGNPMPDSSELDTLRRQVLDQMIDEKLRQAEAKRQGIVVTDADVNHQVDVEIASARERLGGEAGFQKQLKSEGLTEAQLREKYRTDLRKQMSADRLKQKQFPKRTVPQAEAEAYFKAHGDKFPRVAPEVHLQVIQMPPSPESTVVAATLARLQAIRKRITGGEKFAKVAAEVSEDPNSKQSGGDLGFFSRGHMIPEFETATFALANNEMSQPVRTSFGWHLIQALERDTVKTVAGADSLDEAGAPVIEVHARHILLRMTPTDADVERTHATAEYVRDQARKGVDFTTLVHRYSKFTGPSDANGDVGFVSLNNLQPQIRTGLDTLEVGQVSEVLTNQTGFNVFKVIDKHPERVYTLEEVKAELPNAVAEIQRREKYDEWMKSLRAKAQIEYR